MKTNLALVSSQPVALPRFDLDFIKEQLLKDSGYQDWPAERIDLAIEEYQRFLALHRAFPNESLGISEDGDCIWHRHILNTKRYIDDCTSFFGYYFHHTPEFDLDENRRAQEATTRLTHEHFDLDRIAIVWATCVGGGCMNNGD